MRRLTGSIRARLIATLTIGTIVAIALSTTVGTLVLRQYLQDRAESQLTSLSTRLTDSLRSANGTITFPMANLAKFVGPGSSTVVVVADGSAIGAVNGDPALVDQLTQDRTIDDTPRPAADEPRLIAISIDVTGLKLDFSLADGSVVPADRIIIAANTSDDHDTLQRLILVNALAGLGAIGVLIALAVVLVGRGLRPLTTMSDRADAVAAGDRSTRLPANSGDPQIERLARTVNAAFDAQQDAENRVRSFVADASHELRTPLTSASGWVDLYLQGGLTDEARRDHAMQRVDAQLQRMRALIEELAELARLDAGRPFESAAVDLSALAAEVIDDARVVDPDRVFTFESTGAAMVTGDAPRLLQVLRNLVGNATEHTPNGTIVGVRVEVGESAHRLLVTDSGPGIPAENIPHLFERFWRADTGRARESGGSGLGLSIVQSIVVAHGGSISAQSSPATGTIMTVLLPARRA